MPHQPDTAVPARYGPDEPAPANRLIPGVMVERRTEPVTAGKARGKVDLPVPCCDRWARIRPGRLGDQFLVVCTPCGLVYEVELRDELDGCDDQPSYLAILTVQPIVDVTFAWQRPEPPRRVA